MKFHLEITGIPLPPLFELENPKTRSKIHAICAFEKNANDDLIYLPQWMMEYLNVQPMDSINIKTVNLPQGKFVKLKAKSQNFLDIQNPEEV